MNSRRQNTAKNYKRTAVDMDSFFARTDKGDTSRLKNIIFRVPPGWLGNKVENICITPVRKSHLDL